MSKKETKLNKIKKSVYREYAEDIKKVTEWISQYGTPRIIDLEEAKGADSAHIWTEYMLSDRYLSNGFAMPDSDHDRNVSCYWYTPNPWTAKEWTQHIITEIWIDCPVCQEDDDFDDDECYLCDFDELLSFSFLPDELLD